MKVFIGLVVLLLGVSVAGDAASARYQLGEAFTDPDTQNLTVIPMLDTQTGRLFVWSSSQEEWEGGWNLVEIGSPDEVEPAQ
ncbi:MAG: hypothetical protein AAGE65_13190 [Planctomycetota bacterium]